MIRFEKVSFKRFREDIDKFYPLMSENAIRDIYDNIKLPKRSTTGSAGYDFFSPIDTTIFSTHTGLALNNPDGNYKTIPTGIRWVVDGDEQVVLMLYPRSGMGFKFGERLANTVGIIDRDYFLSDNEGHIMVKVGANINEMVINKGKAFVQGVILPFVTVSDEDEITETRNGGFGSTDKQNTEGR